MNTVHPLLALCLLGLLFFCQCSSHEAPKKESLSCHQTLQKFLQCDFTHWVPLQTSNIDSISSYFPNWEYLSYRSYHAGKTYNPVQIKTLPIEEQSEWIEIWQQKDSNQFVKIVVPYPDVTNLPQLLQQLGAPDFKMDFYLDVLLQEAGEWVYLDEGLSLRLGESQEVLWEIILFHPTTKKDYINNIFQSEQAREHPLDWDQELLNEE